MSDTAISKIIQYGTAAERAAFTPDPPLLAGNPVQTLYLWQDTDSTVELYWWDGAAWQAITTGGGGGGIDTFTSAYASRPAASNDGDLFLPNDGYYLERDTGAAWVPWGPIYPLTAPIDGDFAWVNQGGATVSTTNGGIFLTAPANASESIRIRQQSAPSTPYTITTAMIPLTIDVNYGFVHVGFRESSTSKLEMFRFGCDGGVWKLSVIDATNETTDSVAVFNYTNFQPRGPLWLQISDTGTNLVYRVSWEGQHWLTLFTVSRTAWMAGGPNQVWFGADSRTASWDAALTLLSWAET